MQHPEAYADVRKCVPLALAFLFGSTAIALGGCAATVSHSPGSTPPPLATVSLPPMPAPTSAPIPAPPPPAPVPTGGSTRVDEVGQRDIVPVWYATNRVPLDAKDESAGYDSLAGRDLRYGKAFVKIPETYLKALAHPGRWDGVVFKAADDLLMVRNRAPMSASDFLTDIREEIAKSTDPQILIYIHGFNTSFDESLMRGAAIGHNIGLPVAVFSWPSLDKTPAYEGDRDAALASRDALAAYISILAQRTGAKKVHLLAHSMGTMLLLDSLARPKFQQALASGVRFGQVILAAADADTGLFMSNIAYLTPVAERVTLYASKNDRALMASVKVAANRTRVGLLPPPTVVESVDTLDVSDVNLTFLGHAYVANELTVLRDMGALLWHDCPPPKRLGVSAVQLDDSRTYWRLASDTAGNFESTWDNCAH